MRRGSVERRIVLVLLLQLLLAVFLLRELGISWSELRPASGRIVEGRRTLVQRGSGNADKGGHGAEEDEKPSEEPQSEDPRCNPRPNEDRDLSL